MRFAAQGYSAYSTLVLELSQDSEVVCNTMTYQTGSRGIVPRYTTMPKRTPAHTTVGNASIIPGSTSTNPANKRPLPHICPQYLESVNKRGNRWQLSKSHLSQGDAARGISKILAEACQNGPRMVPEDNYFDGFLQTAVSAVHGKRKLIPNIFNKLQQTSTHHHDMLQPSSTSWLSRSGLASRSKRRIRLTPAMDSPDEPSPCKEPMGPVWITQ